jgi:hypothetical protein
MGHDRGQRQRRDREDEREVARRLRGDAGDVRCRLQ